MRLRPWADLTDEQDTDVAALLELYAWVVERHNELEQQVATYKHYATRVAQCLKPTDESHEPSDPVARAEWRRARGEDFWLAMADNAEKSLGHFKRDLHRYTKARSGPPFALKKRWAGTNVPDGYKERAIFMAVGLLLKYCAEDPQGRLLDERMPLDPSSGTYRAECAFLEARVALEGALAERDGAYPSSARVAELRQQLREAMRPANRRAILEKMNARGGPGGTGIEREIAAVVSHILGPGASLSNVLQIYYSLKRHQPLTLVVNNDNDNLS